LPWRGWRGKDRSRNILSYTSQAFSEREKHLKQKICALSSLGNAETNYKLQSPVLTWTLNTARCTHGSLQEGLILHQPVQLLYKVWNRVAILTILTICFTQKAHGETCWQNFKTLSHLFRRSFDSINTFSKKYFTIHLWLD
jgi:hypothetical protein